MIAQASKNGMQIHLSRPGGQREGPFTVEQINHDLATRRYSDSDYWAWYEGLEAWVPLHAVPGVKASSGTTEITPKQEEEQYAIATEVWQAVEASSEGQPVETESQYSEFSGQPNAGAELEDPLVEAQGSFDEPQVSEAQAEAARPEAHDLPRSEPETRPKPAAQASPRTETPEPAAEMAGGSSQSKVFSGMPSKALEHIFIFSSGDGPTLRESGIAAMMMLEIIGENPDNVRERVRRDVFGKCNIGERIRNEGKVPGSAWRAMSALQPDLVQRAKDGMYRTCVRTFSTEMGHIVAAFLFYDKAKL